MEAQRAYHAREKLQSPFLILVPLPNAGCRPVLYIVLQGANPGDSLSEFTIRGYVRRDKPTAVAPGLTSGETNLQRLAQSKNKISERSVLLGRGNLVVMFCFTRIPEPDRKMSEPRFREK